MTHNCKAKWENIILLHMGIEPMTLTSLCDTAYKRHALAN